jgi:hypothetical protein
VADRFGDGQDGSDNKTLGLRDALFQPGAELGASFTRGDGTEVTRFLKFDYEGYADRGVQAPPIHPNCRCDIRPVLDPELGL